VINRLKQPGESDVDTMLRLSLTAALFEATFLSMRAMFSLAMDFNEHFLLFRALWWSAFGASFALSWAAFAIAVFMKIREKR
jgi:hypothetical protein